MFQILIIDDEPFFIEMYSTALKRAGFDVLHAGCGTEGLAIAIERLPSLILLDIRMPITDGYQVLQELKICIETKEIPVFMLTALAQDFEDQRALEFGAARCLSKAHSTPTQIVREVQKYLENG